MSSSISKNEFLFEKNVCLALGDPVDSSLSPVMHNAGYKAAGIDSSFFYHRACVSQKAAEQALNGIRILNVRAASCLMPLKTTVGAFLDSIDTHAQTIGAINTVVNTKGHLKGYNTDWVGVVKALEEVTSLENKQVAVIGYGGAARAAAYGVLQRKAIPFIVGRNAERARTLTDSLKIPFLALNDRNWSEKAEIIINATPVGMNSTESIMSKEQISKNHVIMDTIYHPHQTTLLQYAQEQGATPVFGYKMLLYQGVEQFELFTLQAAPVEAMESALLSSLYNE